ncbi:MAG: hypothetical protein AB8I56_11960 [Anaerolineales bacterium]
MNEGIAVIASLLATPLRLFGEDLLLVPGLKSCGYKPIDLLQRASWQLQ